MSRAVLVHPPFADPTQPYPSLPTLKGWLSARGHEVTVVDLNVRAAHHLLSEPVLTALAERLGARFDTLDALPELDFERQREWLRLHDARRSAEALLAAEPSPLRVFQEEALFYDPAQYSWARMRSDALFEVLSAVHFPFRFGWNQATHHTVPWSFDLLGHYATRGKSPLRSFYDEFADDLGSDLGLFGISVVFPSQIPEALALAAVIRRRHPGALLLLGGPAIHQVAVHLEPAGQKRLLDFVDAIVLFEGERPLEVLLDRLPAWRLATSPATRFVVLKDVPNLLVRDPQTDAPHHGPRWTLDVRESPAPDFDDLDLDAYLAPSRGLLYAPTRGCYWGKCSFCYYGLAETATATYREVPPAIAAAQLGAITEKYGARHVYLSCDVLSPSYAVRLSEALIEQGVDIEWSSDLKIERYFTPERCQTLRKAGLRAAAFGIESGSDRILALIRKGTDRKTMTDVNRYFHDAGIATEWMTFTDHPNETPAEAMETIDWIAEERDAIGLFIVGRFGLERGSDIAQNPSAYGVSQVAFAAGDDLRLYALFTQTMPARTAAETAAIDDAVNGVSADWALHPYPWAGANSTHHTLLHFQRFGQNAFRTHFQSAGPHARTLPRAPASDVPGLRGRTRYDAEALRETERGFLETYLPRALYTTLPGSSSPLAPLSLPDYEQASRRVPAARSARKPPPSPARAR